MIDLAPTFAWFAQSDDERDGAYTGMIEGQLVDLWSEVRDLVGPDRFDPVLGSIRFGKFSAQSHGAWTQTDAEKDSDFINMTLEVDARELSLNVIGWFDPQLEKMERWLRKPAAWRLLRELPDWQLVVFVRKGHVGANGKVVFKGAPGRELERIPFAETSPANISMRLTGIRPRLDSATQKLSLHIRRAWTPAAVPAGEALAETIAREVERWLQPIQDMRVV